jgi:putative glutamine amidotransferase
MANPLIGITTYREQHKDGFPIIAITEAYVQAVSQAGGLPVLIPLGLPEHQLKDLLNRVDGVIFSGGGDIDPARYGGENHPKISSVDPDRDRVELQLVKDVVLRRTPFLGICRGLQTINVALGGSLYTYLPDQLPGEIHPPYDGSKPRDILAHGVEIKLGTHLIEILEKSTVEVNSLHHQGIKQLAPGFIASAFAPDGLIEGAELTDYRFGISVQWHPEWLRTYAPMRAIFREFVEAASV